MVTKLFILTTLVMSAIFILPANAVTHAEFYTFDPDPLHFQYGDVMDVYASAIGEVDPPSLSCEFYLAAFIRNDEALIVSIDTKEWQVSPGNSVLNAALTTEIAAAPNVFYTLDAEVYMRYIGGDVWNFQDSRWEQSVTD
jgi:hypothetical protein